MKLLRIHIISADTCGGLLDGLDFQFRDGSVNISDFNPICLIGPNGAGKSQFLQVIAEIFQAIFHATCQNQERADGNPKLQFEIEYLIRTDRARTDTHVVVERQGDVRPSIVIRKWVGNKLQVCRIDDPKTLALLPSKVVGYTSGDNETLSLPFFLSRNGYATEVRDRATKDDGNSAPIPDPRLMLLDYSTHLELLVSNLLFAGDALRNALLEDARVEKLHSIRCVIQLAHRAVPKERDEERLAKYGRKGIQLTQELEDCLRNLQLCATSYHIEPKTERYTFDFFINRATSKAFKTFWKTPLDLYTTLHKMAMLNDLAIPRLSRNRFRKSTLDRRFTSRLPEPQDEDKVFRFESVNFRASNQNKVVDYVSLSDGEHQLAQVLGTFAMLSAPGVLFLLDEAESHFNPQWRIKLISKLLDLPTPQGSRKDQSMAERQECLLTTHSPFVPSDMSKKNVLIFDKDAKTGTVYIRNPIVETYGTTFDTILEECFEISPPISCLPRSEIARLMKSKSKIRIKEGVSHLGDSVERAFLADRLRQLTMKVGR